MTKVYLNKVHAKVTNELLIINTSRYYMRNINAVYVTRQATYRRYPIVAAIFFLLIAILADSMILAVIAGLFVLVAYLMKTHYHLRLRLYSGETRPLTSTNREELEEIKQAIETALLDDTSSDIEDRIE